MNKDFPLDRENIRKCYQELMVILNKIPGIEDEHRSEFYDLFDDLTLHNKYIFYLRMMTIVRNEKSLDYSVFRVHLRECKVRENERPNNQFIIKHVAGDGNCILHCVIEFLLSTESGWRSGENDCMDLRLLLYKHLFSEQFKGLRESIIGNMTKRINQ